MIALSGTCETRRQRILPLLGPLADCMSVMPISMLATTTSAGCWRGAKHSSWVKLSRCLSLLVDTCMFHITRRDRCAAWTMMYFFNQFGFQSGGILAALTLGLAVKELWRRSCPRLLALQVEMHS
jgi:hypothetical protein